MRKIVFLIFNVRLDLRKINYVLGPAGVAGCMATVLHDATMNPAEGRNTHTHTLCCTVLYSLYSVFIETFILPQRS